MEPEIPFDEVIVDRMEVFDDGAKARFTSKLNGKRILDSVFARPYGDDEDEDEEKTVQDSSIELLTTNNDRIMLRSLFCSSCNAMGNWTPLPHRAALNRSRQLFDLTWGLRLSRYGG